jgi:predicted acyltransferase
VAVTGPAATGGRLVSLDAFRGAVMLLLLSGTYRSVNQGFGFADMAERVPDSAVWHFLGAAFSHVPWRGCSVWDLVMPGFVFAVGMAIPYSYARRHGTGESAGRIALHVVTRSFLLIALGAVGFNILGNLLMGHWPRHINPELSGILPQLGLAYPCAFALRGRAPAVQLTAILLILGVDWVAFVMYPLPPPGFDYASVGVPDTFERFTGLFAHWNKNTNLAAAFDRWLLNLMPRTDPFLFNRGGITTLNFLPTIATMTLGTMAGERLRAAGTLRRKCGELLAAGVACVAIGALADRTVAPLVKALWTPSWAIFSAGWILLVLALFVWLVEIRGWRRWTFPFVVVGMNSLAAYCAAMLFDYYMHRFWERFLFAGPAFGSLYGPIWEALSAMLTVWLMCVVLYRYRIFLRL